MPEQREISVDLSVAEPQTLRERAQAGVRRVTEVKSSLLRPLHRPENRTSPRPELRRRLATWATATAVLTVPGAACSWPGGGNSERSKSPSQQLEASSPADDLASDILTRVKIADALMYHPKTDTSPERPPDPSKARIILEALDPAERAQVQELFEATDLIEASQTIKNLWNSTLDPTKARSEIRVTTPSLLGKLNQAIDQLDASRAISKLNSNTIKPQDARGELEDITDPALKEQANHAVDVINTNSTFQNYITRQINIADAFASLQSILDPVIRERAQIGLSTIIVRQAIQGNNLADLAQARNQVATIHDSKIKTMVENALRVREAAGTAVDDPTSELSVFVYDLRTEFSSKANDERKKFSDFGTQLYYTSQDYEKSADDLLGTSRQEITKLIKDHNNIPAGIDNPISLGTLPNRFAPVDLSNVRGVKKVENIDAIQSGIENPQKLEQFAEFFVADKSLQLKFEPDNGLDSHAIQQIAGLMSDLGPLFYASFASGDLLTVRFIADNFNGSGYLPATREIQIILPKDSSTTIDQLRSTLVHEGTHALTRSALGMESDITPQEMKDLLAGCTAIRTQSLNTAETRFQAMPELLSDLRGQARQEDRAVIDMLIQQIQDGSLDQFLRNRFGADSDEFSNDCLSLDIEALLKEFSGKIGINPKQLEYLKESSAYKKAEEEWRNTERFYAIYSRLNEATYIQSNSKNKEFKGHAEDNVKEVVASTTNDAISFTNQFIQVLRSMEPEEKDASIKAMQLSFDLIINRHESLRGYLTTLEADILMQVNQK